MLVHRNAPGAVRGGGVSCAPWGMVVEEMGSNTGDRRSEAQTGSARARRPLRSRGAANAEQRQMTTAVEAIDFEEDRVPRITVHTDLRRRAG